MKTKRFYEKKETTFNSSMLNIGEMMLDDNDRHIILRTYNGFVSLTDPTYTWEKETHLYGRKLEPGEGITLIQE